MSCTFNLLEGCPVYEDGTKCLSAPIPAPKESDWKQVSSFHESETCFLYSSEDKEEPTVTQLKTCPWCEEVPFTFSERTGNTVSWSLEHDCPSGPLITISCLASREYVLQIWNSYETR